MEINESGECMKESGSIKLIHLDLILFVGAFLLGLGLYIGLHFVFHLHQMIVSAAIIMVMLAYALVVIRIPRLHVRLDQAGDNAYYLGLLFTLVSMAFALSEFGSVAFSESRKILEPTGTQQIIANFGIALASTIAGILLRVTLHQMRIDPAEVESMTRIELSQASNSVSAILKNITIDIGKFHEEIRQRSSDVVMTLLEETNKTVNSINEVFNNTSQEMLTSVGEAHKGILQQTQELTDLLGRIASKAIGAVERLSEVEPPPKILSERLDGLTKVLDAVGDQAERIVSALQETVGTSTSVMNEITNSSTTLSRLAEQMKDSHTGATQIIEASVEKVSTALDSVGQRLEQDRKLLVTLEEQSCKTVEESVRAQAAALEVLNSLINLTKGLTVVLNQANAGDDHGNAT